MNKVKRVLSVQSHVVHGYVGNKSATFPLQLLGFDVDALNSVQFSNHTGYGLVKGTILNEQESKDIIDGLKQNGLLHYDYILSGYMGSEGALRALKYVVEQVSQVNPDVVFVMDPVLGDNGHFYVPKPLIGIYQQEMLHLASLITPNHFEASLLTGIEVDSVEGGWRAVDMLHKQFSPTGKQIPYIVITSIPVGKSEDGDFLYLLGSDGVLGQQFQIKFPKINAQFTGTGDLTAAMILAFLKQTDPDGIDLKRACEYAISIVQQVLKTTLSYQLEFKTLQAQRGIVEPSRAELMNSIELKLIQSRHHILNYNKTVTADTVQNGTVLKQ